MNDSSPEKLRKLRQFIKHHNVADEAPAKRRWWWTCGWVLIALLVAGGLLCFLVEVVDWRGLIPATAPPDEPFVAEPPLADQPTGNWLEDLLADRLGKRERREALLRLANPREERSIGEATWSLQRDAIDELASKYPDDEQVVATVLAHLQRYETRVAALRSLTKLKHCPEEASEALATLAQDRDREVALAALGALVKVDPFRACEVQGEAGALLGSLLKHADREVRTAAIYCLGARQRGKPEDEDTKKLARRLNLLLDDREEQIRTAAAAVLSDIGPAGVEVVTDRWTPPDRPDLRHRSEFHGFEKISPYELWTLAQGGPAALPAAAAVIRDMGHEHSPLSPFVLAEMGTEAAPVLLKEWNGYDSERQFAIEAWGTDALPVYVDAMGSKNWYRAVSAVALLGEKGAPAIPTLTSWLSDRQLRGEAVDKLRGFGPLAKEAISALEKIEMDDEREQREIAATLYCLEPTPQRFAACEKFLAPGLDRKADSEKQRFARDMWHLLKPPPVSLQLEILEKAWDGDIRDRTVFALKQHPELLRPVPPKLLELLRHEKDYVRRAAANVISRIGEAAVQAAPDLIQMTKAPKYEERVAAIDALGAVGAFGWKTEAVGALEACLADGEGSEKRIAAYSLRKIEIESRRLKNPTEKLPEPKEPSLEETLAYLNSDDGPKQEFGDEDVVPSAMSAPPFDLENWKKEFNSARETWHDYDSRITLKRLVHEAALTGKSAAGAVPYLWSLVRQEENRPLRQAALYALWRITQSRLVAYAMIQNNDLVLPIAAETIEQDLLLVPVLISSANYRGLFTLPLSEKAKRAATPFLSGNLDNGWSCAVLWHFYRDPEMLRELEQQLDWQTSISERGGRVVWALGYIGPAAREDVPRLARVAFWNNSPPVSRAASKALWRIDGKGAEDWRLPF